jgi:hypothetical protein
MSNKINDGGPAFPHLRRHISDNTYIPLAEGGMSLRDWFAGQALAGIAMATTTAAIHGIGQVPPPEIEAEWAFATADAMLAAREEGAK